VRLHSRSARAMDIFTTFVQTSKILGVSVYAYFHDRVRRRFEIPPLALSLQKAAASG